MTIVVFAHEEVYGPLNQPLVELIGELTEHTSSQGAIYEIGTRRETQIVLAFAPSDNNSMASAALAATNLFVPTAIVYAGLARGINPVDVVVATGVYNYQRGPEPAIPANPELLNLARRTLVGATFAPIASGTTIISSLKAPQLKRAQKDCPGAIAFESGAYGLMTGVLKKDKSWAFPTISLHGIIPIDGSRAHNEPAAKKAAEAATRLLQTLTS